MFGYTSAQIKTKAVISLIFAIVFCIGSIIMGDLGDLSGIDIKYILLFILSPVCLAWGMLGMLINWKKTFLGLIKPIPIVSYLIEGFKGLIMAPIALIWALSHPGA